MELWGKEVKMCVQLGWNVTKVSAKKQERELQLAEMWKFSCVSE